MNAGTRIGPVAIVIAAAGALVALIGTIGADGPWLATLGRIIVSERSIPDGVPFATAPSAGWPNVPVLAELSLHGVVAAFGDRGWLLVQLAAVVGGLALLAADMRRGDAGESASAFVLVLVVLGSLPALLVIRVQLFSILLFPALAALLRAESRRPSRRIWLTPLLLAVWSNLHGAVLVGLAMTGAYLVFSRARRELPLSAAILGVSVLAICVTPALERTPDYYLGVLRNEAARRGTGLWAPLSFGSAFDWLLIGTAVVLLVLAVRARPALWEAIVLLGLAVLTVKTARSGVWLLFLAAPLAARAVPARPFAHRRAALAACAVLVLLAVLGLGRGPHSLGASDALLREALRRAGGTPILADGVVAEQIAGAGGKVWMSNPLDAFSQRDQRLYVAWLDGRAIGRRALAHAPRVVLVSGGSRAAPLVASAPGLQRVAADAHTILYVRRR